VSRYSEYHGDFLECKKRCLKRSPIDQPSSDISITTHAKVAEDVMFDSNDEDIEFHIRKNTTNRDKDIEFHTTNRPEMTPDPIADERVYCDEHDCSSRLKNAKSLCRHKRRCHGDILCEQCCKRSFRTDAQRFKHYSVILSKHERSAKHARTAPI